MFHSIIPTTPPDIHIVVALQCDIVLHLVQSQCSSRSHVLGSDTGTNTSSFGAWYVARTTPHHCIAAHTWTFRYFQFINTNVRARLASL